MAERMQARLKEGGAFVAVGALHLYGESGVLAELERRGMARHARLLDVGAVTSGQSDTED